MDVMREWVSLEAGAVQYSTSVRSLYRLRAAGRLQFYRRPGMPRVWLDAAELRQAMSAAQVVPVPAAVAK